MNEKLERSVDLMVKKIFNIKNLRTTKFKNEIGFTVVEVIMAASIMTILCVGTLSVYSYVIKINMGNNMRSQALSVLQEEAEFYRAQKFVVDCNVTSNALKAGTYSRGPKPSKDNTIFNVSVTINNDVVNHTFDTPKECTTTMKEIIINATMANPQPGWLANLRTDLTILRVRAN